MKVYLDDIRLLLLLGWGSRSDRSLVCFLLVHQSLLKLLCIDENTSYGTVIANDVDTPIGITEELIGTEDMKFIELGHIDAQFRAQSGL